MAASSRTLKEQYDGIVTKLEFMATDSKLVETRPDDGIFIDDMLLRLKLWAADVRYDQGSFEWAEQLTQTSEPLRGRLRQLDEQCVLYRTASGQVTVESQYLQSKATDSPLQPGQFGS